MENPQTTPQNTDTPVKPSFKDHLERFKSKLLSHYYGHPARELKLICITGDTGTTETASFVHEILTTAGLKSAVLASEDYISTGVLHKFLHDAWKENHKYVIITARAPSLAANVFYGLPIFVAALTHSGDDTAAETTLFKMQPENVVLPLDDPHYDAFKPYQGTISTLTYGTNHNSDIHISDFTLYKKGSEAYITYGQKAFTIASFLTGEPAVASMAAATAIASALHVAPANITDGIANYETITENKDESNSQEHNEI